MKRLLCFVLVIMCLFSCITVFANEDDLDQFINDFIGADAPASQKMMLAASRLGYTDENSTNAPVLSLKETDTGYELWCTYKPEKLFSYIWNNKYYTPTAHDKMYFEIKMSINDGEPLGDLWGPICTMFSHRVYIDSVPTNTVSFIVFQTSKVDEEMNSNDGPYADIIEIKDGHYYLDLEKHKITFTMCPFFVFEDELYGTTWTPEVNFKHITADKLPNTMPLPQADRVMMSTSAQHISMRITPHYEVLAMQKAGHDCQILMRYTLNNKTSKIYQQAYNSVEPFTVFNIGNTKLNDQENTLTVELAYLNATTGVQSDWTSIEAWIQQEPDSQLPSTTPNDDTQALQCGLCGRCPVQPMGICLWMVIAASVTCITAIVIGIMPLVKKAQKSNNKEKPACQSKNLKTPK